MPEADFGISNRWLTAITVSPPNTNTNNNNHNTDNHKKDNHNNRNAGNHILAIMNKLSEHNIETRPLWKPMHLQPVFSGTDYFEHEPGNDVCADLFSKGLCLPSGSNLTFEEQNRVIELLLKYIGG